MSERYRVKFNIQDELVEIEDTQQGTGASLSTQSIVTMLNENKQLKARIEELEKQLEWQPIETAPRDGTEILVSACTAGGQYCGQVVAFWDDMDGNGYRCEPHWRGIAGKDSCYAVRYTPTHWRPLPTPPKAKGE